MITHESIVFVGQFKIFLNSWRSHVSFFTSSIFYTLNYSINFQPVLSWRVLVSGDDDIFEYLLNLKLLCHEA